MPYDKIDQLYDALKKDGAVKKTRENFRGKMLAPGKEGYQNRLQLFNALKADEAVESPTYEEFTKRLGLHAVNTKSAPPAPPASTSWKDKYMAQAQQMQGNVSALTERAKRRMDYAKANAGLDVPRVTLGENGGGVRLGQNRHVVATKPKFSPSSGKMEQTYITESGNEYTSRALADLEQNAIDNETLGLNMTDREISAAQKPANAAVADLWKEAESKYAADREENAADVYGGNPWLHAGREMHTIDASLNTHKNDVSHLTRFDLQKMMDNAWERAGKQMAEQYLQQLQKQYPTAPARQLQRSAEKIARTLSDNAVYKYAVAKNVPKSTLDFFMKTAGDMDLLRKIRKGLARDEAGTTGDLAAYEQAMGDYGKKHRWAQVGGTIMGMALDPTTYLSAGVGSFTGRMALNVGGRIAAKKAATSVGARLFGSKLAGRVATGFAGGAGNFGAYEGINEGANQWVHGGHINAETGKNDGYSASEILKSTRNGAILGSVTGTMSPLLGNVADKWVKATSSTAGKVGIRAGELVTSTIAEGTIFSVPEWLEGGRNAMDVWTDNMAMMLGFKGKHLVESAPSVIAGLCPIKNPRTMQERNHNRMSFVERLRKRAEASPSDMAFAKEERDELRRNGYGDLSELFARPPKQPKKPKTKSASTDGNTKHLDIPEAETEDLSKEWLKRHPEFDGYEAMQRLMQDPNVSQSARAKAYYILTGRQLPMGTVIGCTTDTDDKGNIYVKSVTADGEVVTSRHFSDKASAQREQDRIMRQVELNSVDIGERHREAQADNKAWKTAVAAVAPGADPEVVSRNYKAAKEGDKDAIANYGEMFEAIDKYMEANNNITDAERPDAIRASIEEDTGINVDKALKKEPSKRTGQEQAAVEEYLKRLYAEEPRMSDEKAAASATYDRARLLWDKAEKGNGGAKAEADAIAIRMKEAYQLCEEAFGTDAEVRMAEMAEDPWALANNPELTEDQRDAVFYYINAKAALDGVQDASNDALENKRREAEAYVERRTHKDTGVMQPATMKEGDRPVYIIKGNVVLFPDRAGIDTSKSDRSVIVCDAETGEVEFAGPDQILNVGEAVDPQGELEKAFANIQAEHDAVLGGTENNDGETAQQPATDEQLQQYARNVFNATMQGDGDVALPQEQAELLQQHSQQMLEEEQQHKEEEANREPTALSRVPVNEETQEPMFEKADTGTALDALNEVTGSNEDNTAAIVNAQVEQAQKALDALKKKQPTKKVPTLKGSPMAMLKAQQEAEANYNAATEQHKAQVAEAEETLNAWSRIYALMNERKRAAREQQEAWLRERDQKRHDEAVAQVKEQKRIAAEKAAEQAEVGTHAVNPKIKEKWDKSRKAVGNAQDKKAQSKPEHAVKLGKVVPDNVFARIVGDISRYDRLSDYYADGAAANSALQLLLEAGVINEMELPALRTGNSLSAAGRELIENTLIGKVFQSSPDAVRQIISTPVLRQSVTLALGEIAHNRAFAASGYDLGAELGAAVDLVYRARTAHPGIYRDGVAVSPYGREQGLFDEEYGDSRVTDATVLLLADVLNSGKPSDLRKVFALYNNEAEAPASGQTDMFSGGLRSKEEILKGVNEYFRNATGKEQQDAVSNAVAERKQRAETNSEAGNVTGRSERSANRQGVGGLQEEARDEVANQAMSHDEAIAFIAAMENRAEVAPSVDLSIENWDALFGKDGIVNTPIGEVKMGDNQFTKMMREDRHGKLGMVKPTLENPDVILEDVSKAKEGDTEERPSSYIFVKAFKKADGSRYYYFTSITVSKDGREVVVSNQEKRKNAIANLLSKDRLVWKHADDVSDASDVAQGLYSSQGNVSDLATEGTDAPQTSMSNIETSEPTNSRTDVDSNLEGKSDDTATRQSSDVSVGKGIDNQSDLQEKNEKSPANEGEKPLSQKIAEASAGVNTEPTEAQKEAGNYKKGHVQVGTFDITIEQPHGSVRKGTDANGKQWESKMHNTYGYFRGTEGVDGDHIDVFLSNDIDGWNGRKVYVVDQYNPDGTFDEHKVMLGFNDMGEAKSDYLANYEKGWEDGRRITVSATNLEDFEKWIASSHRKTKPFAEYAGVKKETVANAPAKAESKQVESKGYTIAPATYTDKKGKTSDVHLLTFEKELTAEQERAVNEFAKERTGKGRFAPARGWKDRESGGWMFRTEEDARKAAELAANPEAVADNQPLSAKDMRDAVKTETHEDEDGGKNPAYERKEWTAESDISEMEKREKLLDNALHKNTAEEAELFPEAAAFRAKREALLKKVAAGEMSELQAGEELRTEYADYIKRVNQAAEELSDLRFTLLAAKDNQQRKEAEEAKAQRKKELERKHNGFLKGKTALQASSADKALGKAVEFGEEGAMTIAEYIEKHHAAGDLVFEKKPYDQPHPRRWNAMSGAEQRRWEETHPRKVDYVVNGYFLGKTAYDYAEYLSKNGPAPKSEHSAEGNTSETKAEQPKKNPSGNRLVTDERYEELKKRMRAKLRGQLNMGVDPEILAIGTEMAVYHIEKGARKFAEFAKDMIADLGEAVRPYLKAFYNGARDLPEMAEYAEGLTPYDEVRAFDTANFDKPSKDVFAQAEMVAAESKAEAEAEKAEKAIKDKRNEQRKEQEKQKQTDTGFAQTGADATFADEAATKHNEEAKAEREANAAKGKRRTDDELIGEVLKGNGHNWAKFYKEAIDKGDTEEAYKWYRALGDIIRNTFGGDAERANKWAENVFFPYIGSDAFAGYKYSTKPEAVPAPEGIEPVGKGTFGDVYDQFKGKPQEAAAFLTSHKGGDLLGVFSRDGVGEIDVVWGDERGGFAHILGKHVGEGKSFPTASEAARAIDEIIKTGEVSFENGDKVVFKKDGKVVTIRKNVREGGKKIAAKNWVLTAYDVMSADGGVSAIAPANEVQAARHTDKPRGKVTPKSSNKKANGGKKEKEGQATGDLFAGLTDTSETNKEQDNGLERHHAGVRSEGLPTDGSGQQQGLRGGERSRSQGTGQESGRADAGRRGLGTREDGPLQVGLSGLSERKNKRNNHSERGEDHAPKSVDARIDANIKAIELAQELLGSGETATPEQMGVLRRFSGWGGLGAAFNEASRDWKQRERNKRIRELLGEEAYGQAVLSSKSAYYTPASVVDALWDIAAKLGFKGGSVLEGSAGIGNILGQMPTEMSGRSDIRAIEIDSTSGGILSLLYPDAQVEIQGFEQTRIPNGSVDLAITNVPFVADLRVNDTTGDGDLSKKFRKIQDFCIAKNVRKLREGGIGIFITSNATLDSGKALREWVTGAGGADFIGAFRLNNKTFGGTPVTSDIIVIRKRVNGQKSAQAIDASAVGVERTAEYREKGESKTKRLPMDYNGYFIEHPDHMAGEMRFGFEEGDTYRPTGKGLYPAKGKDQGEMLLAFASSFEEERVGDKSAESENPSLVSDASADGKKVGEMYLKDGKLVVAEAGGYYPLALNANKIKGHTKEECFQAYTAIKTALADVFKYQTENEDDAGLKPLLDKLNKAYDTFVSTYGHFNKNNQLAWLRNDVEYPNVFSLETYKELGDGKGGVTKTYDKADVMSKRVVEKKSEPHPTNVKDGVLVSMSQRGRIDIPYMAGLLGMEEEAVKREILDNGLGFEDPATREVEVAHLYLSGNVREKLRQAEACNENGEYSANIKALQDVVPMSIPAHLIDFSLGSSWLDPKLYSEYVKERTGIDVRFTAAGGTWLMEEPSRVETEMNRSMGVTSELLRTTKLGHELIGAAMQKKTVTMSKSSRRWDGTTETVTDREATAACAAKIDEIRQDFKDWMRQKMQVDAELSARMEREYNDRFNSYAPVKIPEEFAPEHFEGATPKFKMRPHQSKAIVRATMQPLLFAHEVGTGKTFTLISAAMEMRRLGTARKPMIVVQNATVAQFAGDAKELYPNAKILTLEDGDRNAEGRMRFYAKIKYNDWDMVIVPQSVFEKIPDSEKRQIAFIQDKIDEKLATLERMRAANTGKSKSVEVSRAENELEALRAEMAALSDGAAGKLSAKAAQREAVAKKNAAAKAQEMLERRTDEVEDFDDMGIDALLVDEAHEYKHLGFTTAMQRGVKGVDPSYSKKSQSVYLKAQAVLEKNHGRNVVFATGTPISNTAAEVWTFMRYLMSKETMEEYGIYYFDDFVSNFGNIQQMLEFSTSGKYKENNRFAGYVNLPELVRIWSGVADTVLTKDQKELVEKIPELEGGKAQDIYLPQTRSLRSVMKYVRAELARYEEMSGKEKKENSSIPLTMYGIAQAAAIDARLVMAEAEDDPNNKTNEAVRQTLRSLEETDSYKGTVAIFADHYQNKRSGFNLYEDIKAKLVAQGVPASEIVVIKSGMTIKKKQEIFDKVNHGEVRVILGSTSLLGTGVNIQERLHTLIHLDAPNRPMDYTQRNGRILRQGNLHKEWGKPVRVLRFGVEDSLDVTAYQRLKTKGAIADSIMEGERLMADSMNNRVLEEEEDVFGDTVAQLSGSEYAMLKNNAEKNVRKYESRRKQWQADQAYIHSAKPKMEGQIKATEQRAREAEAHLQAVQAAFPGGKFAEIAVGKQKFATVEDMADLVKEHNKKTLDAAKAMKENPTTAGQTSTLTLSLGGYDFSVKTELSRETARSGGALFSEVRRKMTYSCPALGLADVPVRQALLRNAVEDITQNVITGKDFAEQHEAAARQAEHGKSELEQLKKREGKSFEFEKELAEAKRQLEEYAEAMKAEMAEKEKKYAEMDASVEAAAGVAADETADEEAEKFRDSEETELAAEADEELRQAMTERVNELSGRLNTPVRVISTEEEIAALPNERQRRAKGWFDTRTGEVTIVLPNNADAADVENTFLHEVVGHDGLRVLFPEEGQLDNALDELYRVSESGIRERIDAAARGMLEAEVARLMEQKRKQHEAKGENPNTYYYADLAEASLEASKKRDQYRRHAAEEYAADLAGRIGVEGFEKMSAEERTFWGRLKAVLQNALRRLSSGLGIKSKREWTDKEWAYVLHEAYKRKKNGGRPSAFDVADTVVMRGKTKFGEDSRRDDNAELQSANERFNHELTRYQNGEMDKNEMLHLGTPQGVMRAFLPNLPIVMRQRVIKKGSEKKHEVGVSAIMNMPQHLSSPIFVFQRSEDTIGVLTDIRDRNGKNVCVAIELKRQIQQGAEYLEVNDVRSFHGREFKNIVEPIANNKTLKWVDKEKGLAYLSSASQPVQQEIDKQALEAAAKEVKDFVNPNISDDNVEGYNIMFRDGGAELGETIAQMKAAASQANSDKWEAKQKAMKAIGGNLSKLRQAMARQREYDLSTVKSITELAKTLLDNGLLDDLSKHETKRVLSAVNTAHGKEDTSKQVEKVMDIMVDNQLRIGASMLGKLLSARGSKLDARGVEVHGQLDADGQTIAKVVKKAMSLPKASIDERIADALDRMGSGGQAVADEAALEYSGLLLARQYAEGIAESKAEEKDLRDSLKQAKDELDAGTMEADAYREYVAATNDAIRQNKIERAEAYRSIVEKVGGVLGESVERAAQWREAEKRRVGEIHHNANSDMEGRPTDEHHKESKTQKIANNSVVRFLLAPLGTFDQMLRMFGKKSANGEGYLWNRYMRSWLEATEREYKGYQNALQALDEKVSEVFGKKMKWGDLFAMERKMPTATVTFWDGGEQKAHELTQGNLLYIYMVDKMADGRMKLRNMGITEEDIENIKRAIDPRFLELADWMQEEFLVGKRNEYNEVHKRMFGASMAAIENYFPLKILANARAENVDVGDDTSDTALPATSTGSIIKRRRNNLALDVTGADAFSVICSHIQEMERWSAFAEFNRDLNTLLSYKRFRNQVMNMSSAYGGGKALWNNFRNVCSMAAGAYRPPIAALDKAAVNVAKGVTAAKVSFRVFTALKQFLSMPAYLSDSNPIHLAADIVNPAGAWKWSMQNLPIFEKRWKSRMAGDPRLMKSEMDWKMWRSRVVETASRIGMSPNAFVDALTVAIGSHAMYKTKIDKYRRYGYDEETAEKRAKQDATILFNLTQQSSESAFLSTMQVDRSWLSVLFTVFRNSSMSYTRQLHDAIRNIKHRFEPGYKEMSEEFMAKQMRRDGIGPDQADSNAKSEYRRALLHDIARIGVFGCILQFAWNLGAYVPYLLAGDDDDEKKSMWDDVINHTLFGSVEGLTGGDVMSAAGQMALNGDTNWEYLVKDMPLASDLATILRKMPQDKVAAMNDVVNLLVQARIGVNPQSLTDAVAAIMDYCGGEAETSRECALLIARILNCPQSQTDKIYFDELGATAAEASKMTPAEIAERYAEYKIHRSTPFTGWAYPEEERDDVKASLQNRAFGQAKGKADNRVQTDDTRQLLSAYEAISKQQSELSKLKTTDRASYREGMRQLRENNDMRQYGRVKRYKHDMKQLSEKYLHCKDTAERDSIVRVMFATRDKMLDDIGRIKGQQ